jgi:membrane-associated protease RseP (regulator of RpoE activity)
LFLVTIFTTLWAGAYQNNPDPFHPIRGAFQLLWDNPGALAKGIPFAATLMLILVTHEFGHFLFSRIHRVPASFPLFIPGLPFFIGTFGAIIRMRNPILDRRALFDIGVAGPIAGFIVAIPALAVGLSLSRVVPIQSTSGVSLGEPLILQFISWLVFGALPAHLDVVLHPVGLAAWFGLFVTALNLIPIGQLDGGHVAYALWGERQRTLALAVIPILAVLGYVGWQGWFVWIAMAGLVGFGHPPVLNPEMALGRTRVWVGRMAIAIFILTFSPVPVSVR